MNYILLLVISLTDWTLSKLALHIGHAELNPIVEWIGGIDNGLILKIVCWSAVVVLVPALNHQWPSSGDKVLKVTILFYAAVCLNISLIIVKPILTM